MLYYNIDNIVMKFSKSISRLSKILIQNCQNPWCWSQSTIKESTV